MHNRKEHHSPFYKILKHHFSKHVFYIIFSFPEELVHYLESRVSLQHMSWMFEISMKMFYLMHQLIWILKFRYNIYLCKTLNPYNNIWQFFYSRISSRPIFLQLCNFIDLWFCFFTMSKEVTNCRHDCSTFSNLTRTIYILRFKESINQWIHCLMYSCQAMYVFSNWLDLYHKRALYLIKVNIYLIVYLKYIKNTDISNIEKWLNPKVTVFLHCKCQLGCYSLNPYHADMNSISPTAFSKVL